MQPEREAIVLCRYLTGEIPQRNIIERYATSVNEFALPLTASQQKAWNYCIKNPRLLPLADAAWSWDDPLHPLRHRIYIMLSTLEIHRSYQRFFLPVSRNADYIFLIGLRLLRSGFRLIAGKVLLWFL